MPKVAILVDGMYLQHACDEFGTGRIDLTKLPKILLRNGESHHRTYLFDALPYASDIGATSEQVERRKAKKAYFDALQYQEAITIEQGVVRPKRTTCYHCNKEFNVPIQKLVDVRMSVRLVQLAWSKIVDKIVLVTGDGDLLPAVEAVEISGTTVRLAYCSEGNVQTSGALIRKCPEKHQLKGNDLAFCRFESAV